MKTIKLLPALLIMVLVFCKAEAQDTLAFQNFNAIPGQWEYSADPDPYNVSGDIWDMVNELGEITPSSGTSFWGMQDLDNSNGGGNFFHLLLFDTIEISAFTNVNLSCNYQANAFDSGDKLQLELVLNGVTIPVEIVNGASGGYSTNGWETYQYNVPDTVTQLSVTLKAKQNGGTDQAGWDDILITGFPQGSQPLTASFSSDLQNTFCNSPIHFYNNTWGGNPPYQCFWDFNNDSIIDETSENPVFSYPLPGVYSPTLIVTDSINNNDTLTLHDYITITTFPTAWINEFHYDDNSKDTDEGVEIIIENAEQYCPVNFTVSLYNGNNGEPYNAMSVDNFTPGDTIGQYYFYYYYFSSLQNGAPDGIALDYNGSILSYISYEGAFTGTEGPAAGLQSEDVMVQESSSTPVGTSIQLAGNGTGYNHFFWQSEIPNTFGNQNQNQNFVSPMQTVWTGTNGAEWFEAANWDNGIPGPQSNILLDTGAADYPIISQHAYVQNITINDGGFLLDSLDLLTVYHNIKINKLLNGGTYSDDPEDAIYHYIGTPVKTVIAMDAFPTDAFIRAYDEPSQSWQNINGNDTLIPGAGYSVYLPSGNNLISFEDSLVNSNITFTNLTLTGEITSYSGFHLLSNPFTAPIDWDLIEKNNIASTVYVWYNGDYIEWNGLVGNLEEGIIPVAQGFFIQVLDDENIISLTKTAMVPYNEAGIYKKEFSALGIELHYNDMEDNCFLGFSADASHGFDPEYDALKLPSQPFFPGVFIRNNSINYAICFTPNDTSTDYCLGLNIPEDGIYTIAFNGDNFLYENPYYLKDFKTGLTYDLTQTGSIDFQASPEDDPYRFVLTPNPVGINNFLVKEVTLLQKNNSLEISGSYYGTVNIFTVDGKCLYHQNKNTHTAYFTLNPGFYIVCFPDSNIPAEKFIMNR